VVNVIVEKLIKMLLIGSMYLNDLDWLSLENYIYQNVANIMHPKYDQTFYDIKML
jgi:hypothetical protein